MSPIDKKRGNEVASDMIAYQGCYLLDTYSGNDYEPYRTWNDADVFSFEYEFKNKVDEWLDGGKAENKSVGIILQRREYGDERGNLYIWHFNSEGTIVKDTFTEIVKIEDFDTFIQELNSGIPSQYNSITGYYKDAYIDYQFYRPDRRPTEEFTDFRDLLISWKTNPGSFSFSDSRKICIAYERKIPNSISVFTKPTKVNYQVGDCFDKEGLVILAHYPGNINDEIPCDQFRDYLFTFEPTTDTELTATNDKITITCCNKSVDLPIYVEPEVDNISICKMMNYDTYSVGEKLDASGLSITVNYVGGTSREVVYNDDTSSLFGFDPSLDHTYEETDVGIKNYNLSYRDKQTTFNINVLANNKFIVHYDVLGIIHSDYLDVGDSSIESTLNAAIQSGYTGFYRIEASGFYDSKKKYDKTSDQTLTKEETLVLFNSFTGTENVYIGGAIKVTPPAPPTPPSPAPTPVPYNPGGSGGSSGGGSSSPSIGPMGDLTKNQLYQQQLMQQGQINSINNIPQNNLIFDANLAISLLSSIENANMPKTNIMDANGNTGFGRWAKVPGTTTWYFLSGDMSANGTYGTSGFVSSGLYNLSWGTTSGWYSFSATGVMQTGWQQINGKQYYFEPNHSDTDFGKASVGTKMINGQAYNFDANGVLIQ